MITFVKIFYDFGLLLNTDHAFSVFRYLTTIKHFSPYFKNKHMNCARQNQINERKTGIKANEQREDRRTGKQSNSIENKGWFPNDRYDLCDC